MRKGILILMAIFAVNMATVSAQVEQINLEQVPGKFTTETVTVASGDYQFNIANNNVGHEVGFVLVPKGKYGEANHIKEAYVTSTVPTGGSSLTSIVKLEAGEYEYFCPMNPTPKYTLTVRDDIETVKLGQVEGKFNVQALTVSEGTYQFEIANNGVHHDLGFVLVPKGKYGAENHIKAAYVKSPVANGSSSLTNVVELEAGEYEYFCPLNPTPKYSLTVVK